MKTIELTTEQATSARAIQEAIDALGADGGRVLLPAIDLVIDRGLQLRSNVELVGQGERTILRKAPGRIYPLAGYHNYGMCDVPLEFTDGLEPGMTVAIRDKVHGGFFETFGRITWIDGNWVGLDCGLHSDYSANQEPVLVTSYPLIYGLGIENAAVRRLCLDGNRAQQPAGIGACRGAAIYFIHSHHFEVSEVVESDFAGEGLGFQMCSHVSIQRCHFGRNAGNGYHPGAGSTGALFEDCIAEDNDAAGFYFCVRANHITVRNCTFRGNVTCGLSIGTRDCYNRIEDCRMVDNAGPGILVRPTDRPVEVHSCHISGCEVRGNARSGGRGQIDILGEPHDLALVNNDIAGLSSEQGKAGIYAGPSAQRIWLQDNRFQACFPDVIADPASLTKTELLLPCGLDAAQAVHFRHLFPVPADTGSS
ncbi:MAG: right-handed parallel beta-helix repeat-containing protein [Anaerolineae bacterium]|nr:right-handed parallel beta-helix repeat-containing protein [Anaerolineae bacterium]